MFFSKIKFIYVFSFSAIVAGCATPPQGPMGAPGPYTAGSGGVAYGDTKAVSTLSNGFSTTDFQMTAASMVQQMLSSRVIANAKNPPRISFREIENKTGEYIDTSTISQRIRTQLQRSDSIIVVRDSDQDFEKRLRDKQKEQLGLYNKEASQAKSGVNRPDYIFEGTLKSIVQRGGGVKQIDYYINLSLIDVRSNDEVWSGEKEIRKSSASNY